MRSMAGLCYAAMVVIMAVCSAAQAPSIADARAAAPAPSPFSLVTVSGDQAAGSGAVMTDGSGDSNVTSLNSTNVGQAVNVSLMYPIEPPAELTGTWFAQQFATDDNGNCFEFCQTALVAPNSNVVFETSSAPCELLISPRVFETFYGYEATLLLNLTALQYVYNVSCIGAGEGYVYLQTWSLTPEYTCAYYRYNFDSGELYLAQGQTVSDVNNATDACPPPITNTSDLESDAVVAAYTYFTLDSIVPLMADNATCSSGNNTAAIEDVSMAFQQALNDTLTNVCYS